MPTYCVSIALQVEGKLTQAVIYDPNRNDLFHRHSRLWRAFLNNRRIRVSKTTKMRDAPIGTGFPFRDGAAFDEYVTQFKT